jgi:phosphatidylserine/phosphatidylglycerophosphate/cardiolipin synthase-like enzyme
VLTGHYLSVIRENISQSSDAVYVISPYITPDVLEKLLTEVKVPVVVISSWRKSEFTTGIASLSLAKMCKDNGWELRVFHDGHKRKLHSKMYVIDDQVFFGSANLTNSGFQLTDYPNYEILTSTIKESKWEAHLAELISKSQLVDDNLYELFSEKVKLLPPPERTPKWDIPSLGLVPSFIEEDSIMANGVDVTSILWEIMPAKPTDEELAQYEDDEIPLDLFGRRWGSFRRVLYDQSISRDIVDELIDRFYDLMISKYPNDLDNSYREPGGHTECLVWKL